MSVLRLGYLHVGVADLPAARAHYVDVLGLGEVFNGDGPCYLKAWDEWDHHSLVLEPGYPGLRKMGWKVRGADALAGLEQRSDQFGLETERMAKGENEAVGDGFRCRLPSGHVAEFYADIEVVGTETGTHNPDPWPRRGLRGVGVPRLSHVAVTGSDIGATERFLTDVCGFHVTERVIADPDAPDPVVTFLSCGEQPHDIALLTGEPGRLHHLAYEMESWSDILRAGDLFSMTDTPVDVGPTRHGITRGQTIYFFDPTGNRNEVFTGGYRSAHDQPTITWTIDQMPRAVFYIDRTLHERFTTLVS